MALLSRNGLTLAPVSGCPNVVSFNDQFDGDATSKALVAFYPIVNSTMNSAPVQNICPGSIYALKVYYKCVTKTQQCMPKCCDDCCEGYCQSYQRTCPSIKEVKGFLTVNSQNTDTFKVVESPDISSLILFQPTTDSAPIYSGVGFKAVFGSVSNTNTYTFVIQSAGTSDMAKLGYTIPFPILLSDCNICGCPNGTTCGSDGMCIALPNVCPPNAACGDLNGTCSGSCPSGSTCKNVNGLFQCVSDSSSGTIAVIVIVIIIVVIIALIVLFFLGRGLYRRYQVRRVSVAPSAPSVSERSTTVIGSNIY